jgi:signal transduction histidine kinase
MKFWNPNSISSKLTRTNVLVTGIALILTYLSFIVFDLISVRQNLIYSLDTEAAIIGENSVTALTFDDPQAAQNTLGALRRSPHVISASITRPDGSIFAQYRRANLQTQITGAQANPNQRSDGWSENGSLLVQHQIRFGGKLLGTVVVQAETTELLQRTRQFGIISALILFLCFFAAILATGSIRRLITGPLSELAETAQLVSREKNYSVRARIPRSKDELAFLVASFNGMLDQIQQRDLALEDSHFALEQRVRERTAELSAANKELEAFAYTVAHDLRGPLQQIVNVSFMLKLRLAETNDSEDSGLVEKIFEGNRRMSQLIDDILNLSRATSTMLDRKPVDMSEMAAKIMDELRSENPERQVEFKVQRGAHVIVDEGLIRIVLENLIRNAWKYTSKRDNAKIEFGMRPEPQGSVYFVRDNGVGFNPQHTDLLFQPFQRLHSQSEFPGTGVGLATVQRIIARHGGRVWASGEIDGGAEFDFTLPQMDSEKASEVNFEGRVA